MGKVLLCAGTGAVGVVIAALAVGFALESGGMEAAQPANAGLQRPGVSVFAERRTGTDATGAVSPSGRVRLASLDQDFPLEVGPVETTDAIGTVADRFDARFTAAYAAAEVPDASVVFGRPVFPMRLRDAVTPAAPRSSAASPVRLPPARPATVLASLEPMVPQSALAPADSHSDSAVPDNPEVPDADTHTAIYDIKAHVVYMPNGDRLEAHSGLGSAMDDPGAIPIRGRGPTPPNVYNLSLRESIFHGVRALRLTPVGHAKMYGRDGILAHSYMLGPNGQSNGCVSFNDYPKFLNAYLRGDVTRIVVVEHLANAPGSHTGSAWIPEFLKGIFKPS